MKKELLIFGSLLCLMSGIGAVRAQTCATPPSCASLGYTMTSSDCSGQPTLVCPFDASAVFCAGTASSGNSSGGSTGGGAGSGLTESCNGDCFVVHPNNVDGGYKLIYKAKLIDGISSVSTCDSTCAQNGAEVLLLNYRTASGLVNLCIGTNKSGKYYYVGSDSTGWNYYVLDCASKKISSATAVSYLPKPTGCLCARIIG